MPMFTFAVGIGRNVRYADATNFETLLSEDTGAPHILPDQRIPRFGNVRKVALDGTIHRSGKRNVTLSWDYMSQTDFNLLLDTLWPNNETTKDVTLWSLNERGVSDAYNCKVERPEIGEHYSLYHGGSIRELNLRFWGLTRAKLSFNSSFNSSFG